MQTQISPFGRNDELSCFAEVNFRPNAKYFITGSTYLKKQYLESDAAKEKTLEYMLKSFEYFGWEIEDWVLLNNHYRIMAEAPEDATTLSNGINNFHKFSALWIKKISDSKPNRNTLYFARLNYIWFNPVKNNYVENAEDWKFGSYLLRQRNCEKIECIVEKYPWDRVKIEDDF